MYISNEIPSLELWQLLKNPDPNFFWNSYQEKVYKKSLFALWFQKLTRKKQHFSKHESFVESREKRTQYFPFIKSELMICHNDKGVVHPLFVAVYTDLTIRKECGQNLATFKGKKRWSDNGELLSAKNWMQEILRSGKLNMKRLKDKSEMIWNIQIQNVPSYMHTLPLCHNK